MKKNLALLILSIFWIPIFSGCWGANELDTLGIVTATGLDIENDEIVATFEVIKLNPSSKSSSPSGPENAKYIQARGKTIFEAARNASLKFDRRIYLSHDQVYVFGEEFAKKGLTDYMDFLQRDHECRETAYLLVSKGSKAYEVMGISSGAEDLQGIYIGDMMKNSKNTSKAIAVNISEYFRNYYDAGIQPVLGIVEKKEKKHEKDMELKNKDKYEISVEGSAMFNREKLVGYLNGEETRGYNFVRDKVDNATIEFSTVSLDIDSISVPTPKAGGTIDNKDSQIKEYTVVEIIKSKTKNEVEIQDGKIVLKTNVKIRGTIGEELGNIDTSQEKVADAIEEACSKEIKRQIEKAILKAQKEYKVDIFGYGTLFHIKYPKEWEKIKDNWNDMFSEAEFKVDVNTEIIRTGLVNTPSNKVKGE
ncbi:Ger(x)C family spore germination protein [Sporanaerobacter acetigenes]|uniref:Ger(x)C family spore germination protein n=1 Tax=Sporanaerobacter acetigenes TaxID=165813 RepID=UPI00332A5BEC